MLCSVGTAVVPTLTMGMMAHGPGVSQLLFSQGHQHRFSEVRSWDCIEHEAGPAVVLRGSSGSILARPLVWEPTNSAATKAIPAMSERALSLIQMLCRG